MVKEASINQVSMVPLLAKTTLRSENGDFLSTNIPQEPGSIPSNGVSYENNSTSYMDLTHLLSSSEEEAKDIRRGAESMDDHKENFQERQETQQQQQQQQQQLPPLCNQGYSFETCASRFSHSRQNMMHLLDEGNEVGCYAWPKFILNKSTTTTATTLVSRKSSHSIKIAFYGERNTGSNLFQKYTRSTLDHFQVLGHWKHGCAMPVELLGGSIHRTHIVAISKSPYSWLASLYKKPYNDSPGYSAAFRRMDFSMFIRSKFCAISGFCLFFCFVFLCEIMSGLL
jgi:hypothetical protein